MLNISDVYYLLLDEIRADKRGLSCEPDEFSRIARLVNQELYDDYCDRFESGIDNIDSLGGQKIHNLSIPLTLGVGTLPSNYYRLIGKPRILDGSTYRRVDLVAEYEHACREEDYLTQATTTHPTCRIGGINASESMQIRVSPTTITTVYIDYLKTIQVPFLDWYMNDTTKAITFLSETSTLQSIPTGSTYRSGTVGGAAVTVTSLTKNFRFDEGDLSILLTKLVNKVAKQLPDQLLIETSNAEQAKADNA